MRKNFDFLDKNQPNYHAQPLRYHTRALWLLSLFVPLILVPWVLTCILAVRPINANSYFNQKGFTPNEVSAIRNWRIAAQVLDSIAGLITIPILSALLAQAAVVHSQRRKAEQSLSLREMFALADRAWTDLPALWKSLRNYQWRNSRGSNFFLLPAAALIFIATIQQPLSQALLHDSTIPIATQYDTAYMIPNSSTNGNQSTWYLQYIDDPRQYLYLSTSKTYDWKVLGNDIEPSQMALLKIKPILPRIASGLASISVGDPQPNLWIDHMTERMYKNSFDGDRALGGGMSSLAPYLDVEADPEAKFFVAGVRANSTTGVLREHIMRLNSSVKCEQRIYNASIEKCSGDRPFLVAVPISSNGSLGICVHGDYRTSPWNLSRSRQDISEEIFMYYPQGAPKPYMSTIGIHCVVNTTRAYFELGNYRNNNEYGRIVQKWPSDRDIRSNYNDWISLKREVPLEWDTWAEDRPQNNQNDTDDNFVTPGPLMISAMALFGNDSWFSNAASYVLNATTQTEFSDKSAWWQSACGGMPFRRLFPDAYQMSYWSNPCMSTEQKIVDANSRKNNTLLAAFDSWTLQFQPGFDSLVTKLFTTSVFIANREVLTYRSQNLRTKANTPGRVIYSSPGQQVQKPVISRSAMVVLSSLRGLLLFGLVCLAWYIYRIPTWTPALDSMAIARICANLEVEPSGDQRVLVRKQDMANILDSSGLIGIVPENELPEKLRKERIWGNKFGSEVEWYHVDKKLDMRSEEFAPPLQLGLGAQGVISRSSTMGM